MEAGKLNRKITLQAMGTTRDSDGYETENWIDVSDLKSEVITSGGREFYAAQKQNAETTAVFRIRYRVGVNTRMRVKWGNRIFAILSLNPIDRTELLINAHEVV